MKRRTKKTKLSLTKSFTTMAWHKDGLVKEEGKIVGRVYVNGQLANTEGKWQHIVIVGDSKETNL